MVLQGIYVNLKCGPKFVLIVIGYSSTDFNALTNFYKRKFTRIMLLYNKKTEENFTQSANDRCDIMINLKIVLFKNHLILF